MKIAINQEVLVNHNGYYKEGVITSISEKPETDKAGTRPTVYVKFTDQWTGGDWMYASELIERN